MSIGHRAAEIQRSKVDRIYTILHSFIYTTMQRMPAADHYALISGQTAILDSKIVIFHDSCDNSKVTVLTPPTF